MKSSMNKVSGLFQDYKDKEKFNSEYDRIKERLLDEIKGKLNSGLQADTTLINDIKDYGAIIEEQAYTAGVWEGIKLMRVLEGMFKQSVLK